MQRETNHDLLSDDRSQKGSWICKLDHAAFILLCLFFVDVSIFGGGHYIQIGPLSPRMLLIMAAIILAIPGIIRNFVKYIKNPVNILFLAFLLYLAICAVRGIRADNCRMVLASDIKGFAWICLVPLCIALIKSEKHFRTVVNCVLAGALVQSVFVLITNALCVCKPEFFDPIQNWMFNSQTGVLGKINPLIFRVFMKSAPFVILACGIVLYRQISSKRITLRSVLYVAVCGFAILINYTRSLYGGMAVVLLMISLAVILLVKSAGKSYLKCMAAVCAAFFVLTLAQQAILGGNYLKYGLYRVVSTFSVEAAESVPVQEENSEPESAESVSGDTTQETDQTRTQTKRELLEIFKKNPVWGSGLGASAPSRNGPDEYFYLDMLARTGVAGLLLYLLPFGYVLLCCFRRRNALAAFPDGVGVLCGMIGFWAVTWFNPWMNSVLGISCYALCAAIPTISTEVFPQNVPVSAAAANVTEEKED